MRFSSCTANDRALADRVAIEYDVFGPTGTGTNDEIDVEKQTTLSVNTVGSCSVDSGC